MSEAPRTRRVRGTDGYGNDRWLVVTTDGEAGTVTVHAPQPVQFDRLNSTRLLSAIGEADWRLQTGCYADQNSTQDGGSRHVPS